ncbi:MAG: CDGSH iron-sulfur domain-containing protein [Betaproteobacteria bacterium]
MNTIQPQVDGPLKVTGDIEIVTADGVVLGRMAEALLCRCGQSSAKPFCDRSHIEAGFRDDVRVGTYQPKRLDPGTPGPRLRITPKPNGSLRCFGEMQICDGKGTAAWTGGQASLCRCGGSKNKPFCDGTHREIGFTAA